MHPNSALVFNNFAREYFKDGLKVLEIGPDKFPSTYQQMIPNEEITWHTLDIYHHPLLTYCNADEYRYPISDNSYDIVCSGNVLEHVKKIWLWIKELARVCRHGGYVITISPVFMGYHAHPVDCWRAFPDGMRALYEDASLEVLLAEYYSLDIYNIKYTMSTLTNLNHKAKFLLRCALRVINIPPRFHMSDIITIGRKRPNNSDL